MNLIFKPPERYEFAKCQQCGMPHAKRIKDESLRCLWCEIDGNSLMKQDDKDEKDS